MLCFYLHGTGASRQRQEQILRVLHGQDQHSTPVQQMDGEEETHMEQEAIDKEERGLSKDDGEEEEGAP
jgi:hypothetical protein